MEATVDGRRVRWTTGGRTPKPGATAMVFLHGAGDDRTAWALQTRYFAARGYRVVALDLPGHGHSDGPAPTSIEAYAAWLADFCAAVEIERPVVVGHSMGSLIALEFAAHHGVAAACLLGTTPTMAVHPELQRSADAGEHLAYELITGWSLSPHAHIGGHPTPGLWERGGLTRVLERSRPGVLASDLAACSSFHGALQAAAGIAAPVLVIVGDRDLMTPSRTVGPLLEALDDGRLVELSSAGHRMLTDDPDRVIDALAGFLDGPPDGPPDGFALQQ